MAAVETVSPERLFEGYDVLIGGVGSLPVKELSDEEKRLLNVFNANALDALNKVSPEIGADFETYMPVIEALAKVMKAKINKPFGGMFPSSGQFGVGLIIPQDIKYAATASSDNPCYTDYSANSWTLSVTAGTTVHILGDGTHYYKPRTATGYRCIMLILKNGIVEVGSTPSLNQFQFKTEKVSYPAWSVHPLVDQPIAEGYQIYRYNIPVAIPLYYDFGVMLDAMPIATRTIDLRLIGVVFYEYDHRASLTYVS